MRILRGLFGVALSLAWPVSAGCSGGSPESTTGTGGAPAVSSGDEPPVENQTTSVVSTGGVSMSTGTWINHYGDVEDQTMSAFAASATGDTALIGTARGTIDFGNIPWSGSATDTDVVVAKVESSGQAVWSRRYGDSCDQRGSAVALAPSGNVLIAGDFCGKMDFGTTTLDTNGAETDTFVAMIDGLGEDVYSRRFGGKGAQIARAAAVDAKGRSFIVGSFDQGFDDGSGDAPSAGKDDIFVLALDPAGTLLWSRRYGGPEADIPRAVVVDSSGNIVLGGSFGGTVDFGGGPLTAAAGHASAFLLELDPGGNTLWTQTFASDDAVINGLAAGDQGVIVATGSFAGSVDFGGGLITTAGQDDIFVTMVKSLGEIAWGHAFGGPGSERGTAVAFGSGGDLAVTGTADEVLDFGGAALSTTPPDGPNMIYMAHFGVGGVYVTGWLVGSSAPLQSAGIAFHGSSEATLAGSFQAPITVGFEPIPSAGGWDMFLAHQ